MEVTFSAPALFQLGFYVLLLITVIHAVVFSYHWSSFGAARTTSTLGITIYLIGSACFVLLMAVALNFI